MTTTLTTKSGIRNGYDFARDGRTTWVGDSAHKGTEIFFSDHLGQWVAVDLENQQVSTVDRIAAVRLCDPSSDGLAYEDFLACDLDGTGLWIVDAEWLEGLEPGTVEVVFAEV